MFELFPVKVFNRRKRSLFRGKTVFMQKLLECGMLQHTCRGR